MLSTREDSVKVIKLKKSYISKLILKNLKLVLEIVQL